MKITKAIKSKKDINITQKQAHLIFEPEPFYFDWVASLNFVVFTLSLFFSPITPLGILIGMTELILTFFILKWNFIKRCKVPK